MVKFRVADVVGHARVALVEPDPWIDVQADRARAEALRANRLRDLVSGLDRTLWAGVRNIWRRIRADQRRRLAIAQLSALDDRMLRDIGLDRTKIAVAVDGLLANQGKTA